MPERRLDEILAAQLQEYEAGRRRQIQGEIESLEVQLRLSPQPALYASVAKLHRALGDQDKDEATLRRGIAACPSDAGLVWSLSKTLHSKGKVEEAIALAAPAMRQIPNGLQFRLLQRLTLPSIYDTEQEVGLWRRRFGQGVKACQQDIASGNPGALEAYSEGLRNFVNFLLPYQERNDVELERRYGAFVHRVMQARYPQWSGPLSMFDVGPDSKVRVGCFSRFLYNHSVGKLFIGWPEHCNRNRLQIHLYYSGRKEDSVTNRYRQASDFFYQIPDDFEAICAQIRKDRLHVLIFLDIGLSSKTTMLAALRLAPVQCTTWLHPGTSGLPTIDYFLSNELMEPPEAQKHYSESLVLLPGIGMYLEQPTRPRALLKKPRSAWGIPEDAIAYLCCQSLFKYLPRYDYIFPEIARRVSKARFVFFEHEAAPASQFQKRLSRAFSEAGLNADSHCLILPRQPLFDFWNLNLVSDVFLDSLGYSGGVTTLEALAFELPVVTLPGKFMRGRQSYGMLTRLGVTETIASSEADYIDIAERIGLDTGWRRDIARKLAENRHKLFADGDSVRALDDFVLQAVEAASTRPNF